MAIRELVAHLFTIAEVFAYIHMRRTMFCNSVSNIGPARITNRSSNQSTIRIRIDNNFIILIFYSARIGRRLRLRRSRGVALLGIVVFRFGVRARDGTGIRLALGLLSSSRLVVLCGVRFLVILCRVFTVNDRLIIDGNFILYSGIFCKARINDAGVNNFAIHIENNENISFCVKRYGQDAGDNYAVLVGRIELRRPLQ